jgi:5'-nucleotidase/UDP-sugar diphosphatase
MPRFERPRPRWLLAALLLAALLLAALSAAATAGDGQPPATPPEPEKPARAVVTILDTNDWHGFAFAEMRGRKSPTLMGGAVACAAAIARIRAERPGAVLALDAGDLLSGHPAAGFIDDGVTGLAFARLWGTIGFDAWTIGNHDLDHGTENLEKIVAAARSPVICANLKKPGGAGPLVPSVPYKIFDLAGVKVGVIGLTTGDLGRLISGETMSHLECEDPIEVARPLVAKLRPEVAVLVALTHLGAEQDHALAKALPAFDAIIGGHSHTRMQRPELEGKTVIVQAGAHGRELGRLDLTVERGRVTEHAWRLLPLPLDEAAAPKEVLEESRKLEARMRVLESEIIGETAHALGRGNYYAATDCGSFIADAFRLACGTDVGFVNSGGVRGEFPQGKISRAMLLAVLPFDDELATFEATGAEIEAICRWNATAAVTRDHGVLQVSGLRYKWRRTAGGGAEIISIEVGGKPLDKAKKYTCATNQFLLFQQAKKYFGYEPPSRKKLETTMQAAVIAAFKNGPVERPDRGRMWEERGKSEPVPTGADGGKETGSGKGAGAEEE